MEDYSLNMYCGAVHIILSSCWSLFFRAFMRPMTLYTYAGTIYGPDLGSSYLLVISMRMTTYNSKIVYT